MPRRDGTGPMGAAGRGFGGCGRTNAVKCGAGMGGGLRLGLGCRRGFGRGFGSCPTDGQTASKTQKELLQEQKALLESRLDAIDRQLESL